MNGFKLIINPNLNKDKAGRYCLGIEITSFMQFHAIRELLKLDMFTDYFGNNFIHELKTKCCKFGVFESINNSVTPVNRFTKVLIKALKAKKSANGNYIANDNNSPITIVDFLNLFICKRKFKLVEFYLKNYLAGDPQYIYINSKLDSNSMRSIVYRNEDIIIEMFPTGKGKPNGFIKNILNSYQEQKIRTAPCIHNTMHDLFVYTSDPKVISIVLRNNQDIINTLVDSFETPVENSESETSKLVDSLIEEQAASLIKELRANLFLKESEV